MKLFELKGSHTGTFCVKLSSDVMLGEDTCCSSENHVNFFNNILPASSPWRLDVSFSF